MGRELQDRYERIPEYLSNIDQLCVYEVERAIELLNIVSSKKNDLIIELEQRGELLSYYSTLIRFSFSALVDADWLNTESYFSPQLAEKRQYEAPSFHSFQGKLEKYANELPLDEFSKVKNSIQIEAKEAGKLDKTFFSLHTPTGTGKTIAYLLFALSHCIEYSKRRIIIALPLMNLTEQTSSLCRNVFGQGHVVEDHSGNNMKEMNGGEFEYSHLATENWQSPFVITTTIQLFESLFHNKPSKVRKLHQIAGSIIILDEYHTLPPPVLQPILDQLYILQRYFGITVLLASATPFALDESKNIKLKELPYEIIPKSEKLYTSLLRVKFEYTPQPKTIQELAMELASEQSSVLTIVNTRKDAQSLFRKLIEENHNFEEIYHLSSTMCSDHRMRTLDQIKESLHKNIAVIATSVVEVGVDLSFPAVYRMISPLESIIQSAGRCNRYDLRKKGKVKIFELLDGTPTNEVYEQGVAMSRNLLNQVGESCLYSPKWIKHYFKQRLSNEPSLNKYDLYGEKLIQFKAIAKEFKLIEDNRISAICNNYRFIDNTIFDVTMPSKKWWRKIQPYTVNIFENEVERLKSIHGVPILNDVYHEKLGILL